MRVALYSMKPLNGAFHACRQRFPTFLTQKLAYSGNQLVDSDIRNLFSRTFKSAVSAGSYMVHNSDHVPIECINRTMLFQLVLVNPLSHISYQNLSYCLRFEISKTIIYLTYFHHPRILSRCSYIYTLKQADLYKELNIMGIATLPQLGKIRFTEMTEQTGFRVVQ